MENSVEKDNNLPCKHEEERNLAPYFMDDETTDLHNLEEAEHYGEDVAFCFGSPLTDEEDTECYDEHNINESSFFTLVAKDDHDETIPLHVIDDVHKAVTSHESIDTFDIHQHTSDFDPRLLTQPKKEEKKLPEIYIMSYLREAHHMVRTCKVFDVPSLCKAEKKDLVTFIEVNCTVQDRGHLNLSSMVKVDLLRHAVTILLPKDRPLPGSVQLLLTPYKACSETELLLLGQQRRLIPKTTRLRPSSKQVLCLIMKGPQQPIVLTVASEKCRRAATERCLIAIEKNFEDARYEEECKRFLDWAQRDGLAHKKPGMLLDRVQWLQQLDIPYANGIARYLSRHIIPFLLLRPDVILSDHGCWEALKIDRMLQNVIVARSNESAIISEKKNGFFQRISWMDKSQLREPQRLAVESLQRSCNSSNSNNDDGDCEIEPNEPKEYEALIALRIWFSRVLHATFSGTEPPLQDGERIFDSLKTIDAKLSALPKMIVLPTGVGKSGVICLAPFVLEKRKPGRVLVVCPSVAIREQLTLSFKSFYAERVAMEEVPKVFEIDGAWNHKERIDFDVFIASFHRLGGNNLLSDYPRHYFDLVLVDEAHHAEALTYKLLREHFCSAQFFYFTGTPYRSDHQPLRAELLYSCTMKEALQRDDPYIKRLCYLPLPVKRLTLKSETSGEERTFNSFDEVVENAGEIAGTLRLSLEARSHVIGFAIWKLRRMRKVSGVYHQAILQASDTSEAEFLTWIWDAHPENQKDSNLKHPDEMKFSIATIHSQMPSDKVQYIIQRLKENKLDAIVHVGMIGEGFDHPQLSLCCIFKRFASMSPVTQLLGRILRRISGAGEEDNNAYVIVHPGFGFHKHWKVYKQEDELPDHSQLSLNNDGESTHKWTDVEETYEFSDTIHADWFPLK